MPPAFFRLSRHVYREFLKSALICQRTLRTDTPRSKAYWSVSFYDKISKYLLSFYYCVCHTVTYRGSVRACFKSSALQKMRGNGFSGSAMVTPFSSGRAARFYTAFSFIMTVPIHYFPGYHLNTSCHVLIFLTYAVFL